VILTILELLRRKTEPIYYIVSGSVPKDQFWRISLCDKEVWIVHPDSLVAFEFICERARRVEITPEMILAEIHDRCQQSTIAWEGTATEV